MILLISSLIEEYRIKQNESSKKLKFQFLKYIFLYRIKKED